MSSSDDTAAEPAVIAGNEILQKFRSAKAKDASFGISSKSFANDDNSISVGYYDAIADGSNLGMSYSASKRRDGANMSSLVSASGVSLFMQTPVERDTPLRSGSDAESIDLLRDVLARLAFLQQSGKENVPGDISDIIVLLQVRAWP